MGAPIPAVFDQRHFHLPSARPQERSRVDNGDVAMRLARTSSDSEPARARVFRRPLALHLRPGCLAERVDFIGYLALKTWESHARANAVDAVVAEGDAALGLKG